MYSKRPVLSVSVSTVLFGTWNPSEAQGFGLLMFVRTDLQRRLVFLQQGLADVILHGHKAGLMSCIVLIR